MLGTPESMFESLNLKDLSRYINIPVVSMYIYLSQKMKTTSLIETMLGIRERESTSAVECTYGQDYPLKTKSFFQRTCYLE